jgi:flagellum-specific peptidoglycan hydrolase FlgJ
MKQEHRSSHSLRHAHQKANISQQRSDIGPNRPLFLSDIPPLHIFLRQLLRGLRRWVMALKYQLAQLLPSSLRLPWFKVALALLLVFVLFKRDLQFQVNLHAPGVSAVDDQNARSQRTNLLATGSEAIPKTSRNNAPEKRSNPFVASPNDSEKDKKVKAYIRRFAKVAQAESKKYGIPASVKMAQAIVESSAGSSKLATRNNNHFGIKCFSKSCGQGHCSNFSDDHHKDFFRIYDSAWESWRAHSNLLSSKKYKSLQKHGNDYKAWAEGLKKIGYATDPNYPTKLVNIIERYELTYLDQ